MGGDFIGRQTGMIRYVVQRDLILMSFVLMITIRSFLAQGVSITMKIKDALLALMGIGALQQKHRMEDVGQINFLMVETAKIKMETKHYEI